MVTTGTVDLLGILSASQVLSSETGIERLHARVVEVLRAMTGATGVQLVLWSDDRQDWLLLSTPGSDARTVPITGIGVQRAAPMSVLRYIQRMPEPLVVRDATHDDRFARDPHFTGLTCCSLLAVPILGRAMLRAVLLLENRLMRGAFTTERLDAVKLIAGQLAVSLDNTQLYGELAALAEQQAALRRVATLVAREVSATELFSAVADEMASCLHLGNATVIRFDSDSAITIVALGRLEPGLTNIPLIGQQLSLEGDNLALRVLHRPCGADGQPRGRSRPGLRSHPRDGASRHRGGSDRRQRPGLGDGRPGFFGIGAVATGHRGAHRRLCRPSRHRHRRRDSPRRPDRLAGADRRGRR
jgi:GAF domain-containing protein